MGLTKIDEALEAIEQVKTLLSGKSYTEAYLIAKKCDELMKAAKEKLIEKKIDEVYPELGYKIKVSPAKERWKIPNAELIKAIGQDKFNDIATVSQSALERSVSKERYEELICLLTRDKEACEQAQPYISVTKMSADDKVKRRIGHK